MTRFALGAAACMAAVVCARPAAPCEPLAAIGARQVYPGLGAAQVPVNAVVYVTYAGTTDEIATPGLSLWTHGGGAVEVDVNALPASGAMRRTFAVVPRRPLAPNTQYDVVDRMRVPCAWAPCAGGPEPTVSFTTGEVTVAGHPAAPRLVVSEQTAHVCEEADCCGPYHEVLTQVDNPGVGVRYDLYDHGVLVESNAPLVLATNCHPGDRGFPGAFPAVVIGEGTHHLALRAFDQAGNESARATALTVDISCDLVDASQWSGCGVAGGDAPPPWGALALSGAAVAAARSRRRPGATRGGNPRPRNACAAHAPHCSGCVEMRRPTRPMLARPVLASSHHERPRPGLPRHHPPVHP
jgi:MYXO-CTERM domain-containing protein